uniref:Fibroblast growth factor n=1 Tax=Astyanax mexicanus TaxID=7994 RepID=A0A8B9H3D3_ASTMX
IFKSSEINIFSTFLFLQCFFSLSVSLMVLSPFVNPCCVCVCVCVCVCAGILEIRSVSEGGVLAIKGVKSQYYICMRNNGMLYGMKEYTNSCVFKEVFLENYYTGYSSNTWKKDGKEIFISLSKKGQPLKPKKARRENGASHFIPRKCTQDGKTLA